MKKLMISCLTCNNKYPYGTKYCLGCGRVVNIKGNINHNIQNSKIKIKLNAGELEQLALKKNKTNEEYVTLSEWYDVPIKEVIEMEILEHEMEIAKEREEERKIATKKRREEERKTKESENIGYIIGIFLMILIVAVGGFS